MAHLAMHRCRLSGRLTPFVRGKTALAEQIGVSPTSGGYFNNLGRLRTLGMINYPVPREVRAAEVLFPRWP